MKDKHIAIIVIIIALCVGLLVFFLVEALQEAKSKSKIEKTLPNVSEVSLSDGTRCVVFWTGASYQGDIECNWPDKPPPTGEKK